MTTQAQLAARGSHSAESLPVCICLRYFLNLHHLAQSNFNEPPFMTPIDSDPGLNFSNYRIACRIVSVYYHQNDENKASYASVLLDVSFDMTDAVLGMCSIVL